MGTFGCAGASSASLRSLALVDVLICTPPRARIARLAYEAPARPHIVLPTSALALRDARPANLVSPVGIEPTTNWLKASCSTTELRARCCHRQKAVQHTGRFRPCQERRPWAGYSLQST